jgi:NADP-dependent aldehyde dehydrogenase
MQPVLLDGVWCEAEAPMGSFRAVDPSTKQSLPEEFPVSGPNDVRRAFAAAERAVEELRQASPETLARFLEEFAGRIEANAEPLGARAALETGLPVEPRLRSVELPRTTSQMRQAAAAVRDRSWVRATIDTKARIRSMHGPLGGPVVVFGPNNFPFAFNSVAGGDFVAAIAAGNPVIGKANTGHPGTSELLARCALDALVATGLPRAAVQLLYRTPQDVGYELVSHPAVGATGFTGSRSAGLRLKRAADEAGKPIYLEMAAVNPLFVLPGALKERGSAIAKELFDSCALGAGQFCTKPGLTVVLAGERTEAFIDESRTLFEQAAPGTLLGPGGPEGIALGIAELERHGATILAGGRAVEGTRYAFSNTLLRATGEALLASPRGLQTEAFGSVNLIVVAADDAELDAVARVLEGSLTVTLYTDTGGADDALYSRLEPVLRRKAGRLLNDKMPTGVAVTAAMNHGGPYPATGHPGFTAVGIPASILRFTALHCYDNVRPHRLPPELGDRNPTGAMWRLVDGQWTQGDVGV